MMSEQKNYYTINYKYGSSLYKKFCITKLRKQIT